MGEKVHRTNRKISIDFNQEKKMGSPLQETDEYLEHTCVLKPGEVINTYQADCPSLDRYIAQLRCTPADHPYMPNQDLWYVYDTHKDVRSMGCYVFCDDCQAVVDEKNGVIPV